MDRFIIDPNGFSLQISTMSFLWAFSSVQFFTLSMCQSSSSNYSFPYPFKINASPSDVFPYINTYFYIKFSSAAVWGLENMTKL